MISGTYLLLPLFRLSSTCGSVLDIRSKLIAPRDHRRLSLCRSRIPIINELFATYTIEGKEAQVKDFRKLRVSLHPKDIQHGINGLSDELDVEADLILVFKKIDGSCQDQGKGRRAAQGVL
jgi:hypothetical protein